MTTQSTSIPALNLPGLRSESGSKVVRQHTRAGVTFWPQDGIPISPYKSRSLDPIDTTWDHKRTKGALISLSWSKKMGKSSGSWRATFKDNSPYRMDFERGDVLPDDWADLSVLRNGLVIPICRGIVDDVRRSTHSPGGVTVRSWNVSGRDHGAFFETSIAYSNLWVRTLGELVQGLYTERVGAKVGGNPSEMFKTLIDASYQGGKSSSIRLLPPKMGTSSGVNTTPSSDRLAQALRSSFPSPSSQPNGSMLDILNIEKSGTRGAYYNESELWTQAGGTLHQAIGNWCNPVMNEFIYDLELGDNFASTGKTSTKMVARIRERPFVAVEPVDMMFPASDLDIGTGMNSPWFNLPTWTIPTWAVNNDTLGISGAERFNLFELLASVGLGSEQEQFAQCPPSWDYEGMKRHGIRPMVESTKYLADPSKGMAQWVSDRRGWQQLLVNWYCLNPWLWSGTVTIPLALPEIKVGHRLRLTPGNPSKQYTFYVEGVDLEYKTGNQNTPPAWSTTFSVTRGFRGTDRQLLQAVKDASAQYKMKF